MSKRILTTGISKVTLPAMPEMPRLDAAPTKMAGVRGAGFGAPTSISGSQDASAGRGLISFFGLHESGGGSFADTFYDLKQTQTHRSNRYDRAKKRATEAHCFRSFASRKEKCRR